MTVIEVSQPVYMLTGTYIAQVDGDTKRVAQEGRAIAVEVDLTDITLVDEGVTGTVEIIWQRSYDAQDWTDIDTTGALDAPGTDAWFIDWLDVATNDYMKPTYIRCIANGDGDTESFTVTASYREQLEIG